MKYKLLRFTLLSLLVMLFTDGMAQDASTFRDIKADLTQLQDLATGSDVFIKVAENGAISQTDNAEEANKYNYPRFREVGANLLSCEYEQETEVNGGKSDYCLQILKKPLLMRYSEEHKQLTTYTLEQFQCPLSMTEINCAIDDYFRYRIARTSGKTLKILHTSLYKYCHFDRKMAYKARERFPDFLDFYVKVGLIHGYSLETDAISINL